MSEDPSSFSNPLEVKVVSSHIVWRVDFEHSKLVGHVDHNAEVVKDGSSSLVFDTRALEITRVTLVAQGDPELPFKLGPETSDVFGTPLRVTIPAQLRTAGSKFTVRVHYSTKPDDPSSTALQWVTPAQTAGGVHPYLYSQCQAIHARSMLPCQDTPSSKIKYSASVTISRDLAVVMSATSKGDATNGTEKTFEFAQDVPIMTYLIAIAAGNIVSRDLYPDDPNSRSKVWSEPETVDQGVYEFANTEKFIKAGEDLLHPYVWGRYDLVLLPPSFPYGGMENPQLTFVTPTLIAGDRSLENVIAHEIAHSWMGNLVTNRYWSEFFLNEGFTVFMERKIIARMRGAPHFDFEALMGLKELKDTVDLLYENGQQEFTVLRPNMEGISPDDSFSKVPYEKGFIFLCYLEGIVGIPGFEKWLKDYVTKFQYQSITADQMKAFFIETFKDVPEVAEIDWNTWFDAPGMPVVIPKFSTELAEPAIALAQRWIDNGATGAKPEDIQSFSSGQTCYFLDQLLVKTAEKPLSVQTIADMEKIYDFTTTGNSEIKFRWHDLCIASDYTAIFEPHVVTFITEQGRMKFVEPLYRALYNHPEGKDLALKTYDENQDFYHPIAAGKIEDILELDEEKAKLKKSKKTKKTESC